LARQFDIVENRNLARRGQYPYLVVLQHDRIAKLGSVIAAPLVEATDRLIESRLHPSILLAGRRYALIVEELAAIQISSLGRVVGFAEPVRYAVVAALDLLFTGI
jgi:toxin CcdB